jgi:hypothetical protein
MPQVQMDCSDKEKSPTSVIANHPFRGFFCRKTTAICSDAQFFPVLRCHRTVAAKMKAEGMTHLAPLCSGVEVVPAKLLQLR